MCPPACNIGVPVRVWAVQRDVPVSLVPRIVGSDLEPEKDGNCLVGVYPMSFLFEFSWGMHSAVCLCLSCKDLINRLSASHCYPRLLNQLAMISLIDGTL
jgi:hypothetical protein